MGFDLGILCSLNMQKEIYFIFSSFLEADDFASEHHFNDIQALFVIVWMRVYFAQS